MTCFNTFFVLLLDRFPFLIYFLLEAFFQDV